MPLKPCRPSICWISRNTPENEPIPRPPAPRFIYFSSGRDDVHEILKHVLRRVSVSLYLNMFGYDDDELNDIIMSKVKDPSITVLITLDKSQAGGVHEKALIDADRATADGLAAFNSHFVIGQSPTHQISHTKGFVADGKVGAEGSTNWSASGEGTGVFLVKKPAGFKAQNNTQTIFTDPDSINRFQTELIAEHMAAQSQQEHIVPNAEHRQRKLPATQRPQQAAVTAADVASG